MKRKLDPWDMSLEQFISKFKSIRNERRIQFTGCFSRTRSCGCDYYMFIEIETLKPINPYTKKDKGKKYKSFFSSMSAEHVKEMAYDYIKSVIDE